MTSFRSACVLIGIQILFMFTGCSRKEIRELPAVELCFVLDSSHPDYSGAPRLDANGKTLIVSNLESFHLKKARSTKVQYTETQVDCYIVDEELPRFHTFIKKAVGHELVVKLGSWILPTGSTIGQYLYVAVSIHCEGGLDEKQLTYVKNALSAVWIE